MKQFTMTRRSLRFACAGAAMALFANAALAADDATTLRDAAKGKVLVGTCVMSQQLDDAALSAFVAKEYDCITPENEMKPDEVHPGKGKFNFAPGDKICAFAAAHDMKVVGHTLVWHNQSPKWLYADESGKPLPREQALANMKEHITTVMGHFKGKVIGWDVVNEAIDDGPGYLRETPAKKAIGDDYIVQAFKFAAEADPTCGLYYNDYSNENPDKRAKCLKLIQSLKDAGCKIDAVGLQGHWALPYPDPKVIDDAITDYAKLGIKVNVTELDVDVLPRKTGGAEVTATEKNGADPFKTGLPDEVAKKQADRYAAFFKVFEKHAGDVDRVTFWGTHDGLSWLNDWPVRGRTNHALLFTRDMKPKAAEQSVVEALEAWPAK